MAAYHVFKFEEIPTITDVSLLNDTVAELDRLYWSEQPNPYTDAEFDALVVRLRGLDPDAPALKTLGGMGVPEGALVPAGKVAHKRPMLSLEKAYTDAEIAGWMARNGITEVIVTPKIDGMALSIRYDENGDLAIITTRGNGTLGEDVTPTASAMNSIPRKATPGLEVRGEAFIPIQVFRDKHADTYANARNLAAGSIKQKDPARVPLMGVVFMAYDTFGLPEGVATTFEDGLKHLERLGFTIPMRFSFRDPIQAGPVFRAMEQSLANGYIAETDGLVYRSNNLDDVARLGVTSHHPRYAIAYKFQGQAGTTRIRGIEWQVSRTGRINPVAELNPITLSGASISRASLHNLSNMALLCNDGRKIVPGMNPECRVGVDAVVRIQRSGGVIPHITAVETPSTATLYVPDRCPDCGAPTYVDGDFLVADHGPTCKPVVRAWIEHYLTTLGILGIGPAILDQMMDAGLVKTPADLYRVTEADLRDLDRFGDASAANLVTAVQSSRSVPAHLFLASLGIQGVGRTVSKKLLSAHSLDDLLALRDPTILHAIDGVGPLVSQAFVSGIAARGELIIDLLQYLRIVAPVAEETTEGPLSGTAWVFTGTLAAMKRSEAQAKVRALGGTTPDSVNKDTTYLVVAGSDFSAYARGSGSSKTKKAEKLGVQILSEDQFLERVG